MTADLSQKMTSRLLQREIYTSRLQNELSKLDAKRLRSLVKSSLGGVRGGREERRVGRGVSGGERGGDADQATYVAPKF